MTGYDLEHSQDLEHALETRWPTADDRLPSASVDGVVGEMIARLQSGQVTAGQRLALLTAIGDARGREARR